MVKVKKFKVSKDILECSGYIKTFKRTKGDQKTTATLKYFDIKKKTPLQTRPDNASYQILRPRISLNKMAITATTKSMWMMLPILKTKNPSNHPMMRMTARIYNKSLMII
jgi:ribosomal protein S8